MFLFLCGVLSRSFLQTHPHSPPSLRLPRFHSQWNLEHPRHFENGPELFSIGGPSGLQTSTPTINHLTASPGIDWCQLQPQPACGARGKCVNKPDKHECHCYARWTGPNCQIDNGTLPTYDQFFTLPRTPLHHAFYYNMYLCSF